MWVGTQEAHSPQVRYCWVSWHFGQVIGSALGGQPVFQGGTDREVPPAEEFIEHERTDASDGQDTACATGEVMKDILLDWASFTKTFIFKQIFAFCTKTLLSKPPRMTIQNSLGPPEVSDFDSAT